MTYSTDFYRGKTHAYLAAQHVGLFAVMELVDTLDEGDFRNGFVVVERELRSNGKA